MALGTANGFSVIEAVVTLPRTGRWSADLAIDAPDATGLEGVAFSVTLGSKLSLQGTCRTAGEFAGGVTVELVGGAAGLLKQVPPKAFQQCELELPLADVLGVVGETLSPTADAATLTAALPKWIRLAGTANEEISSLLGAAPAGAVARILPDGTLWVGVDSYPDSGLTPADYQLLRDDSHRGVAEIGVEEPSLLPGTLFLGRQVEEVKHTVMADAVRTTVQFAAQATASSESGSSSHTADLDEQILRRVRPTRFHRSCPGKVVAQNGDGTLEIVLDDGDFPGLSAVPIREFAPGVTVQVAGGSRCRVTFAGGDPQAPEVVSFEAGPGSTTAITILAPMKVGAAEPTDAAALASKVLTRLNAIEATFNAHTHLAGVLVAPPGGGAVTGTTATALPVASSTTEVSSTNLLLNS